LARTRRTSMIIDPPDGRVPPMTPEARKKFQAIQEKFTVHPADGPEDRPLPDRCLMFSQSGPPMIPGNYNDLYQIVQTPEYISILAEMGNQVRVIPLDGRPHLPGNVQEWMGDSRGHWEGNTLVVETTNFSGKAHFRGATDKMHLIERFTRSAADTLTYEFTVDDPATFAKPWTASIPMVKSDGPIYEYACHEGNY